MPVISGFALFTACGLAVDNPNSPDTERVLATELEVLVGSQYLRHHAGLYNGLLSAYPIVLVQSFENFSMLCNSCMCNRLGIPRAQNDNGFTGACNPFQSALAALDRAIEVASAPTSGADGFPLPVTWIPGPVAWTTPEFIRLVRSYRARFRATIARSPAEGAAADCDAIIADAQNGITGDHLIQTNTTTGPFNGVVGQFHAYDNWHQMAPFIIGMADNSGAHQEWLEQPLNPTTTSSGSTPGGLPATPAFPRTASSPFLPRQSSTSWEPKPLSQRELCRGRRADQPDPGQPRRSTRHHRARSDDPGSGWPELCSQNTGRTELYDHCLRGMFEALKCEKRIETVYTHFGAWWLDMRGWAELAEGTGVSGACPRALCPGAPDRAALQHRRGWTTGRRAEGDLWVVAFPSFPQFIALAAARFSGGARGTGARRAARPSADRFR